MQLHKDSVATISDQLQMNPNEIEQAIYSMGDEYFGTRYRDG
jgi:hypothetical protein